jgi:hypothetical protein
MAHGVARRKQLRAAVRPYLIESPRFGEVLGVGDETSHRLKRCLSLRS